MDVKAAQEGPENISTPSEMMTLLAALYQNKVLNKALTEDFFKVLGTPKQSDIRRSTSPRMWCTPISRGNWRECATIWESCLCQTGLL